MKGNCKQETREEVIIISGENFTTSFVMIFDSKWVGVGSVSIGFSLNSHLTTLHFLSESETTWFC